jgi:hypothetical protein
VHTNGTLPRPTTAGRSGALPPHPRNGGGHRAQPPPAAVGPGYSLPRASNGSTGYGSAGSYGSYDRRIGYGGPPLPGHHPAGLDAPDHYFMPSQRKYSGEFLRVYVDYNK